MAANPEQAANPNQLENTWLSYVRHELRTPVNLLLGYSEIILEEQDPSIPCPDWIADVKTIHRCGQQILSLANMISDSDGEPVATSQIRGKFQMSLEQILNCTETLLEMAISAEVHADVKKIQTATQLLGNNIDRFIELSIHQPRYQQIQDQPIDIGESPIHASMVEDAAKTISALNAHASHPHEAACQSKILVIDDKEDNRHLLSRQLRCQGYQVNAVPNGQQALQSLEKESYDLLLLDILMPEMNGYQVLQRLKTHGTWQHIPIIIISALHSVDSIAKCIQMGADDYLQKPFNLVLLKARVDACLEKKRLRDQEHLHLEQLAQAHGEILRKNQELERLATLDGLTQVSNRRRFDTQLQQEWQRLARTEQPLAIILLDIDYFKQYNDQYGHLGGDDCLKQVAQAIATTLQRPSDLVARYGGEEFVVILPNTNLEGGKNVAESIRAAIAALKIDHALSDISDYVTASVGVASMMPHLNQSPQKLVNVADQALYKAKRTGRNQVVSTPVVLETAMENG